MPSGRFGVCLLFVGLCVCVCVCVCVSLVLFACLLACDVLFFVVCVFLF